MRLFKKHTDALASKLDGEDVKNIKNAVADDAVRGWSVFDSDGVELISEGVSETVTAVCSNILDLSVKVGDELNETDTRPSITLIKGSREMHAEALMSANIVILRDKVSGGFRTEAHNGR